MRRTDRRVTLTDAGREALEAAERRKLRLARDPEPPAGDEPALGRSPAVLPGQKQGAASEPPPPELQPYEKASCRQCKALLRELGAATDAFTEFTRPRLRRYAAMSYGQVLEFKAQLAPLSRRVKAAREAYEKHAEVCL